MHKIDEAIAHEKEKAKDIRKNIIDRSNLELYEICCNTITERSAEEHEQLAEWLEELKELKEYFNSTEIGKYRFRKGYNKAIDDFIKLIESKRCIRYTRNYVIELAEQLKVGGENE